MLVLQHFFTKCVRIEIIINLHDLGMNLASKAHNERIKHAQMLCEFTPNNCLMYLTTTKPYIKHVVSLLSMYMHCSSELHFQSVKRIFRYAKGTLEYVVRFVQVKNFNLHGYLN